MLYIVEMILKIYVSQNYFYDYQFYGIMYEENDLYVKFFKLFKFQLNCNFIMIVRYFENMIKIRGYSNFY